MKLIVGLGNPGRIYAGSRHNIGFEVVRSLAKASKIPLKKDKKISALSGQGRIENCEAILALPLTYMNLSGLAAGELLRKHKIDLSGLLVVCDDLDLELGTLRIRSGGSSGGHRGLKSIMDSLESQDFCRLRIGIGRPRGNLDAAEYVLSPFTRQERGSLYQALENAVDCCRLWVSEGIAKSMNIFNRGANK